MFGWFFLRGVLLNPELNHPWQKRQVKGGWLWGGKDPSQIRSCKATHRPMMRSKIRYNQTDLDMLNWNLAFVAHVFVLGSDIIAVIIVCLLQFTTYCISFHSLTTLPMFSHWFSFDDPCLVLLDHRRSKPGRTCCSWKMDCRQDCHFPNHLFLGILFSKVYEGLYVPFPPTRSSSLKL